eukprot:CAMPEP_0172572824 /NCGR_PEP_ID=MMETSP1067-20121228/135877_1 /TAXON_ID=265564 ORGANISM="Thalassiosira punctigera, Strain Tpunct2005C2" /NCGR_SAMPLE_ID=MMETSP1067 /ASSEMBLY_ACC=CAM_ASM_000444 /LENGTH=127 /DNA_ID=CAMNT_0013365415 /DNA_START=906 /DNA_END=1289 /DNA_ORIENTATION=+
MKINSLLLAVLAAFANAQDAVDPADAQDTVDSCQTKMDSVKACLIEDVDESCKTCIEGKFGAVAGEQSLEEMANFPDTEVLGLIVDECEDQDDWCKACASELDVYLACKVEVQEAMIQQAPIEMSTS